MNDPDPRSHGTAHRPSGTKAILLIALLCLIWGSTWIVIQGGLRDLPPFTSAATRFVIAAGAMTVVAHLLHRKEGGERPPFTLSLTLGGLNFGASYGIVYWTETRLPSSLVCVLWSVFPMLMAISGHLYLPAERLRGRQWGGFAVGFLGIVLLFATDLRGIGAEAMGAGAILLASPIVSVVGTTVVKRRGARVSSVLVNRDAMWIGAAMLSALAWFFERDAERHWTGAAIASVLYLSLAGTVVTFSLYFWLLRHVAANRMSLIAYVTPVVALLLGGLVGREPITGWTLAGTGLVLAGVGLVVRRRSTQIREQQGLAHPAAPPAPPRSRDPGSPGN
jgi:drug/metabolite transporter (DMT)-like permease